MIHHNGINYYNLSFLTFDLDNIPQKEGIYYWIHCPKFDPDKIAFDDLISLLTDYTKTNISLTESFEKFKFKAEIGESSFPQNGNLFGLSNEKERLLKLYLEQDKNHVIKFADFFSNACFRRPFYIGKAVNLRKRIKQHIEGTSNSIIIDELSKMGINENNIWIGFEEFYIGDEQNISAIFEEILQRIVKPGLTKKPG